MTTTAHMTRHRSATVGRLEHERPIALRLQKTELEEAHQKSDELDRSASNFARLIYLMGMQLHRRTGLLRLPDDAVEVVADHVGATPAAAHTPIAVKA